jgi:M6 family metalloprotease-like protein
MMLRLFRLKIVLAASIALLASLSIGVLVAQAAPAAPHTYTVVQPDGTRIQVRNWGDEWRHWVETTDGYTVVFNDAAKRWEYAAPGADGTLAPSGLVVGLDAPAGLAKHLTPPQPEQPDPASARLAAGLYAPPAKGNHPLLVILVQFTDRTLITTEADWGQHFFTGGGAYFTAGSVKDFWYDNSYGQIVLTPAAESYGTPNNGVVIVTLPRNHPNPSTTGTANQQITRDAILAADPFVNYAAFDTNRDGYLSSNELHLFIVVAGAEASYGGNCGLPQVWAHHWALGFNGVAAPLVDGVFAADYRGAPTFGPYQGGYNQIGELHCDPPGPGHIATIGPSAHELGHDMGTGVPDLYDTDGSSEGIGQWGLQGSGAWNGKGVPGGTSGTHPAHSSAWEKWFLGLLTPTQVAGVPTLLSFPAVETASGLSRGVVQVLDNPNGVDWDWDSPGAGEYFLVENRQKIGFDAGLPGAGLLIWHIDESAVNNDNEGNSPPGGRRLVVLEQADGQYDLECFASGPCNNRGDAGDLWVNSISGFGLFSWPSSRLYSNTPSGARVIQIGLSGLVMTATVGTQAFADVPQSYWAWPQIEALNNSGITNGCGSGNYCPADNTTRAQAAIFLLRGKYGSGYTPPPATGIFADAPTSYWAVNWIEQLYNEGITKGCASSPLSYCPERNVTRAEMAVFLLRAKYGRGYTPPAATGIFADVPTAYWAAAWIEKLYADGITSGCGANSLRYCPEANVPRAQAAVFLVRTFNLLTP